MQNLLQIVGVMWLKDFMMHEIKRNSQPYIEIESFEDYELTYCCMYEMAIRSPWFERELQEIINLYEKYDPDADDIIEIDENILDEITKPSTFATLVDKILGLGLPSYTSFIMKKMPKVQTVLEICNVLGIPKNLSKDSHDAHTMIERVPAEHKTYIKRHLSLSCCDIVNTFIIDEWLLRNDVSPGLFKGDGTLKAKEILNDLQERDLMGLIRKEISTYPKMNRPYLKLFQMHGLQVSVNLDFSLPKHELLSYISLMKDHLDEESSFVSPVELLDKELTDLFSFPLLENKKGQKQFKLATMFYIYDAFKQGMKQSQIKQEISYYNGANIDERTIKGYYTITKTLIDDEKFKYLTRFIIL